MNKWRKSCSGIEGEEMTVVQLAEYKKIKAELREARLGIDFRDKAAVFFSDGSSSQEHDARTPLRQGRQPPWNLCDVPLSGWCRIQGCYTLARQGYVGNPQSAVEELAIFVTCLPHTSSEQTHLLEAGPQSLGTRVVLQPVPRDGAPAHAAWRAWRGCHTLPQGPQLPCLLPTWQGVPT